MVAVLGGQKWRQILDDIGKALNASLEKKDLREAASDLIVAEDLCRLVDGGTAALVPDKPFDPVEGSRRLRVLNLLVGQMNRTLNDHYWSAEKNNPGASPYYLGAANAYADFAKPLTEAGSDSPANPDRLKNGLGDVQARLKQPTKLAVEPLPRLDITSEQQFEAVWTVKEEGTVPRGVPMAWLQPSAGLSLPAGEEYTGRRELRDWLPARVAYPLSSTAPDNAQKQPVSTGKPLAESAVLRFVYRGQREEMRTDIWINLAADTIVYRYPETDKAGIAVRADADVSQGALTILVDATGSMHTKNAAGVTRWDQVTKALEEVLVEIPSGTRVSVWMFGHKTPGANAVLLRVGGFESNVERILDPVVWNRDDPTQFKNLMRKVRLQEPSGHTPIMDTMIRAKPDLEGATGFKTMLILTDGEDNMYQGNIPKSLRENFNNSDIFIAMAFFQVSTEKEAARDNTSELERAEAMFGEIRKLSLPGAVSNTNDGKKLVAILQPVMRPKYQVEKDGSPVPSKLADGFNVAMSRENRAWSEPQPPDFYTLRVHKRYTQNVRLRASRAPAHQSQAHEQRHCL